MSQDNKSTRSYNLWNLLDRRIIEANEHAPLQIVCDIDKTYLETSFDSIVKIAKIAFEEASDKVTVDGASELLGRWRWSGRSEGLGPRGIHFVSSSPPQLRDILEEKLVMDGLDWSSDCFKNQVYNLKKGRFDLLLHQVAYKSAGILRIIEEQEPGTHFYLLGDSAEADSYIYIGIKLYVENRLSDSAYLQYLTSAGVEKEFAYDLLAGLSSRPSAFIDGIYIRDLADYKIKVLSPWTDILFLFSSFFDIAIMFHLLGIFSGEDLWFFVRCFHNRYDVSLGSIVTKLNQAKKVANPESLDSLESIIQRINVGFNEDNNAGIYEYFNSTHLDNWHNLNEDEILTQAKAWWDDIHELRKNS